MPFTEKVNYPVKAGVGVSARIFKKAVDRNRIKRLLREAYRLNKSLLTINDARQEKPIALFFLYTGKEMPDFVLLNEKMQQALTKLESILD